MQRRKEVKPMNRCSGCDGRRAQTEHRGVWEKHRGWLLVEDRVTFVQNYIHGKGGQRLKVVHNWSMLDCTTRACVSVWISDQTKRTCCRVLAPAWTRLGWINFLDVWELKQLEMEDRTGGLSKSNLYSACEGQWSITLSTPAWGSSLGSVTQLCINTTSITSHCQTALPQPL